MEILKPCPESYRSLCNRLDLKHGIPYVEKWSACADFLELISDQVLTLKPDNILECGSGLTTLILARSCQLKGYGHVYTLENGEQYAEQTRSVLDTYGLQTYATVIHAPLVEYTLEDKSYHWYSLTELLVEQVNMFVIDGPPGFIQKNSRYPALPLLHERLADGCLIYLDDAAREDELEIVQLWQQQFSDTVFEYLSFERGCNKGMIRRMGG